MASRPGGGDGRDRGQLLRVIRKVRNRWRLRTFLRGAAVLAGATLAAFLVTAYGLELFRFSATAVTAFRALTYAALAVVAYVHLVRPLARRVDDERVALYLEENEPSLEASVLTAVGAPREDRDPLLEHLVREALARSRAVEYGERVDRGRLYRYSGVLAGVGVVGILLFLLGPSTLRTGASALLFPDRGADDLTPFAIEVAPGDVTVARGSDQVVRARLVGFESGEVELVTLAPDGGVREALPMFPGEEEGYEHVLLDLEEPVRYFVRSSGVRSATFTLDVAEIPYVQRLDLVYHFPDYTGLEPRTVEDGGNIAVLPGTRVEFRASSSVATSAGRIVLDDSTELGLEPDSANLLTGELTVRERSGYRIELERPDGRMGAASPHFTIDLLEDQPPGVEFEKPGRDTRASPIDEVFLQVRGDDDYGVSSLDLVYSVNGSAEDTVALVTGQSDLPTEASAGHTFFLEEWDLVPGDVVSYYAVVRDNNRMSGPRETVSDIYFLDVRPFRKDYSAAAQQGGGGGGGGGAMDQGAYVEVQREIVAATFNLLRDRESYDEDQWRSDLTSVSLSQQRLRGDVSTLVDRIRTRLSGAQGEEFATIAEELPKAVAAMEEAVEHLEAEEARVALGPEQKALLHLQRADEAYRDVQVSMQQGGGGGGGQQTPRAEDLADLFELELDQLRNQYETVQRGQRQEASQELDQTMERLKELARRQQQEAERQARRQAAGGGATAGGARQQSLAEETEEVARRLERLARQERSQELEETARQLKDAADAMRRAAASGQGEGASAAQGAAERLERARRLLEDSRAARFQEEIDRAVERARRLRQEQEEIAEEVTGLDPEGAERRQATRRLNERKGEMAGDVADLAADLDRAAARARREDRAAAGPLQEAAGGIREDKLEEKIRFSRGLISTGDDRASSFEEQIAEDFESLVERLGRAGEAAREGDDGSSLERALDDARSLARGMETLERRLQEQADGSPDEADGEAGARGEDGRQARSAEGSRAGEQAGQAGEQGGQTGQRAPQEGGQEGSAGQQQGGAPAGQQGGGVDGRSSGGASNGGLRGGRPPLDPESARQFRREFGERARDARTLRDRLREGGRETEDLDRAIEVMTALDDRRVYTDLDEILRLQRAAVESLERLEFSLRRELEARDGPAMRLPGSDDVPPEFRDVVEEYYRVLSEGGAPDGS